MKRSNFLKSLATLVVAPSLIGKIEVDKPKKYKWDYFNRDRRYKANKLIEDLQLLTPKYYESYISKYGSEQYGLFLEEYEKQKTENT